MSKNKNNNKPNDEKWKYLVELAPDGIMTMNVAGFITSINDAFLDLTGFSEKEIVGKHFTKLGTIKIRDIPQYTRLFYDLLRGKITDPYEFEWATKSGDIKWGEAHYKLIEYSNKREILLMVRDVTDRKKKDELIKKSMEDLERSNRELDDYTYAVSHDLKAPLRTITSFSGFILEDYSDKLDDSSKEYLNRIIGASKRMSELIEELLILSRVGRKYTEIETIDLNKLVDAITLDLSAILEEKNGKIIKNELPSMTTQKVWIRQLFTNIISNGLKFNESETPTVWIDYEDKSEYNQFSIRDNGIGIEEKYYEKLFKIFQRLHTQDEYPGTGAGLSICKKIIEFWGGEIWVESKLGQGSTFFFTIPKNIEVEIESGTEKTPVDDFPETEIQTIHG